MLRNNKNILLSSSEQTKSKFISSADANSLFRLLNVVDNFSGTHGFKRNLYCRQTGEGNLYFHPAAGGCAAWAKLPWRCLCTCVTSLGGGGTATASLLFLAGVLPAAPHAPTAPPLLQLHARCSPCPLAFLSASHGPNASPADRDRVRR